MKSRKSVATLIATPLAFLSLLIAEPQYAAAEVKISVKTEYYSVRGRSLESLDRSLYKNAPVFNGTERALGQARLRFQSNIKSEMSNGKCRVVDPGVKLSVVMILPRWRDEKRSGTELRTMWRGFSGYVRAHEERHVAIATKHAKRLQKMFTRVPAAPSCKLMESRLTAGAKRVLTEHRREQENFDAQEQRKLARAMRRAIARR